MSVVSRPRGWTHRHERGLMRVATTRNATCRFSFACHFGLGCWGVHTEEEHVHFRQMEHLRGLEQAVGCVYCTERCCNKPSCRGADCTTSSELNSCNSAERSPHSREAEEEENAQAAQSEGLAEEEEVSTDYLTETDNIRCCDKGYGPG